jgi:hypothetical protein
VVGAQMLVHVAQVSAKDKNHGPWLDGKYSI